MKNSSYANRGAAFEEFLRFANDRYAQKKIAVVEKLPTEWIPLRNASGKICGAKVERKSKVDFIGRYKKYPIAIEAKNTNEDSIRFDEVQKHQAEYMDQFTEEPGTIGLVLISFNLKRFFVIPWAFWSVAYDIRVRRNDRTTPVTVSAFGQTWTIPKKFSVRVDELNPQWEIPNHDFTYGLHYLAPAEKYIVTPQPKIPEN
ncbi:MAG: Holliday junction resolvase RecU [Faecousia sp.]